MQKEKQIIKKKLEQELENHHFTKGDIVLQRTHPITWKQKFNHLWNKEIEVPLVPIATIFALVLLTVGLRGTIFEEENANSEVRELVEIAGSTYWKDQLEQVVVLYEDKNKD